MRGLVQRVEQAAVDVTVDGETTRSGEIGPGLLVLVGATHTDTELTARKLADKIWNLRIMNDADGVMNLSVADTTKAVLVVSQFTLYGDTTTGRRPSWIAAAKPDAAEPLVDAVVTELKRLGATVVTGQFRTDMKITLVNDGPCTVLVEV
jgi:D-tyrosyl-tRNA(Tyr) deacylase